MRIIKISQGFTLLELMIVMVILAIGVALAVPTFQNVTQRRQTTAKAEELAAFLAYAQSEAVKKNSPVSVELRYTDANDWCVGVDESDGGCDCGPESVDLCTIEGVTMTLGSETLEHSSMVAPADDADLIFAFDPVRGIMIAEDLTPSHTFTIESDNTNYQLRVEVSPTGRVKICNSDSSKVVPGYKACS